MRRSEWVLLAYFLYTSILALILPLRAPIPALTVVLNLSIFSAYALLIYADALRRREPLGIVRDWFPLILALLAYREMGWFQPMVRSYKWERIWVEWDRILLRGWGVHAVIEGWGPALPTVLEIAYSLVYVIGPFSLAMLYVYRCRDRADRFLFLFLLGVLLAYVQFPWWPSEPPRTVFPGEDFPSLETIFRKFNLALVGFYGIHTSVFPSAHVSGAFSAAFAMMRVLPEKPWVGRLLLALAILIAVATVYGRYHYAADAVAGFALSLVAWAIALTVEGRRSTITKWNPSGAS